MTGDVADHLSWAPQKSVFIRRALLGGALTFGILFLFGAFLLFIISKPNNPDVSIAWVLPFAFLFTLAFNLEDVLRWRSARYDRWQISNGHLLHEDLDGNAMIPLADIKDVREGFGNRVIISLTSGKRIVMRYMSNPIQITQQINAIRRKL